MIVPPLTFRGRLFTSTRQKLPLEKKGPVALARERLFTYVECEPKDNARPGKSAYFMVPGRKVTSGHHMSDAGISVRPCAESRSWVVRSLSSR